MNRESTFSLTVMVIIMAMLAVFIGYLLGNWLIQLVTGDTSEPEQVVQREIINEETIEDENDQKAITEIESQPGIDENKENEYQTVPPSDENTQEQLQGDVFVVQVGAFREYKNAQNLKEELEAKGFQVIISEEQPYKVQVGATNEREEAEKTGQKLKELGYDIYITH